MILESKKERLILLWRIISKSTNNLTVLWWYDFLNILQYCTNIRCFYVWFYVVYRTHKLLLICSKEVSFQFFRMNSRQITILSYFLLYSVELSYPQHFGKSNTNLYSENIQRKRSISVYFLSWSVITSA